MTPTIVAAIDIGTNSVKMTVGDSHGHVLHDETAITRLGKRVDGSGRLDPDAVTRTLKALEGFAARALSFGATKIAAVGTSALRDASDAPEFLAQATRILGGDAVAISGDREAQLTFLAATRDPILAIAPGELVATSDIGGGSTELVIGSGAKILLRESLQLGAVRVTERISPSDPWTDGDLENARELIRKTLPELPALPNGARPRLIASGGTAANLASVKIALAKPDPDAIHATVLSRETIAALAETLAGKPLSERRETIGLEPDRADVIVAGALVQVALCDWLGVDEIVVSARGLRFGLLHALLENQPVAG